MHHISICSAAYVAPGHLFVLSKTNFAAVRRHVTQISIHAGFTGYWKCNKSFQFSKSG